MGTRRKKDPKSPSSMWKRWCRPDPDRDSPFLYAPGNWRSCTLLHIAPTFRHLSHLLLFRTLQPNHPRGRCFLPDLPRGRQSDLRHSPRFMAGHFVHQTIFRPIAI